jgi:hypothetical protein
MTASEKHKKKKAGSGQTSGAAYAPQAWARGLGHHDLALPSGGVILARRVGPTELVKGGLLSKVDVLAGIVQSEHIDRVAGKQKAEEDVTAELRALLANPEKLTDAMGLIDAVVIMTVVKPTVSPNPEDEEDVDLDAIYVRSIPEDDKMFVLQWTLGGTTDLATIREELNRNVDALSAGEDNEEPAE